MTIVEWCFPKGQPSKSASSFQNHSTCQSPEGLINEALFTPDVIGVNCGVHDLWNTALSCSVQPNASFHKHECKCIHHLHCIEEKQLSVNITIDSWNVCLILDRKKSKSLFYHKFWACFQLTDFWCKCWTCKDTQVSSSTARKGLQSLFAYFFVTQYKLMYLILIVFDWAWWQGQVPEDWRKANITPIFKKGKRTQGTTGWLVSPQYLVR